MSLPPINPEKSASGISVDPRTLERVVASSRRADGSVRKELKIRPGFTPQEDVGKFRTARQQVAESRKTGPRVVPGWAPPVEQPAKKPKAPKAPAAEGTPPKRSVPNSKKDKKAKAAAEVVKDSWEDDEPSAETAGSSSTADPKPISGDNGVLELAKELERAEIKS